MKPLIKGIMIAAGIVLLLHTVLQKTRFSYYNPIFQPFSTRLNAEKLLLEVGDTYQLRPQALNKRVSYKSSNFRIVDVMPSGKIYAKAVGTAIITASGKSGKGQCKVTVISISSDKLSLTVGESTKLYIKGSNKRVKWSCNSKIAIVDKKGVVKAILPGTATITATIGGKELECNVYIKNIP